MTLFFRFIKKLVKRIFFEARALIYILSKKEETIQSKKIIILGNGPSLKNDIQRILEHRTECEVMCTNSFVTDPVFEIIKPSYYVFADPAFFNQNISNYNKKVYENVLSELKSKLKWPITFIFPKGCENCNFVKEMSAFNFCSFQFVTNESGKSFFFNNYLLYNKNYCAPRFQNVLIECIYFVIYKRFKSIYIFGADHDWAKDIIVGKDNFVYFEEKHFYEKEIERYRRYELPDGSPFSMGQLFDAWAYVYNAYYDLKKYADFNCSKIFNESSNSYIDAFPRESGLFTDKTEGL